MGSASFTPAVWLLLHAGGSTPMRRVMGGQGEVIESPIMLEREVQVGRESGISVNNGTRLLAAFQLTEPNTRAVRTAKGAWERIGTGDGSCSSNYLTTWTRS